MRCHFHKDVVGVAFLGNDDFIDFSALAYALQGQACALTETVFGEEKVKYVNRQRVQLLVYVDQQNGRARASGINLRGNCDQT